MKYCMKAGIYFMPEINEVTVSLLILFWSQLLGKKKWTLPTPEIVSFHQQQNSDLKRIKTKDMEVHSTRQVYNL